MEQKTEKNLRIDKWLWHARVYKTRTLAQKQVKSGNIRLNRNKVTNPAAKVMSGDVLTIARNEKILIYRIVDCGTRRGPYEEARTLYEDLSPAKTETQHQSKPVFSPTPGAGPRPSKHDRRKRMDFQNPQS